MQVLGAHARAHRRPLLLLTRSNKSFIVSSLTMFLEKSTKKSPSAVSTVALHGGRKRKKEMNSALGTRTDVLLPARNSNATVSCAPELVESLCVFLKHITHVPCFGRLVVLFQCLIGSSLSQGSGHSSCFALKGAAQTCTEQEVGSHSGGEYTERMNGPVHP